MTGPEHLAVVAAGLGAGLLTSTVGVASMISFPALIALGIPPVVANASNTIGLLPGALSGSFGYRRELREVSRPTTIAVVLTCAIGAIGGAALLLALPPDTRPTGIVCGNDAMAIGALAALAAAGLRVPGDVSVTGYDDLPQAPYTVPPLTTVAQPVVEVAAAAVERLLARVERPATAPRPGHTVFPVRLVIRRSTAPPAR